MGQGLNNQSLDILARGRWTMESTVVEVGITSDIPQSQQIVEMVQGAVQAALRRSGNTNVTLVQLPTVYSSSENEATGASAPAAATSASNVDGAATPTTASADAQTTPAASVVIEDVIDEDDDDDTPTNEHSTDNNSTTTTPPTANAGGSDENASSSTGAEDGENGDGSRRRTGTRVLAGVIQQMRNVQARLNPFVDQYYELLQGEQNFDENVREQKKYQNKIKFIHIHITGYYRS